MSKLSSYKHTGFGYTHDRNSYRTRDRAIGWGYVFWRVGHFYRFMSIPPRGHFYRFTANFRVNFYRFTATANFCFGALRAPCTQTQSHYIQEIRTDLRDDYLSFFSRR